MDAEALHAAVKRADLQAMRRALAAGASPNALDAAGLPPLAYLLDQENGFGFGITDRIAEMIRILRFAGADPILNGARGRVLQEAWSNVSSALEANDARRLEALLDFRPTAANASAAGSLTAAAVQARPATQPQATEAPCIAKAPLPKGYKVLMSAALLFVMLASVALGVVAAGELGRGKGPDGLLALTVALLLFGLAAWGMRASARKTLRSLERIVAATGLTATVDAGWGVVVAPRVEGVTPRGRMSATSSGSIGGGSPYTRIELANPVDMAGLSEWIVSDLSRHSLKGVGASLSAEKVYRIEVLGVIAQPSVADFIIRLVTKMRETPA